MGPELLSTTFEVHGPAGLQLHSRPVPADGPVRHTFEVEPGTPSLVAALDATRESHLFAVRLLLEGPDGIVHGPAPGQGIAIASHRGNPVAVTVLDPACGTWDVHVHAVAPVPAPLHLRVLSTPFEDAFDALHAATAHLPVHASLLTGGLPLETLPFLAPVGRALQPLAGTALDVDDAAHAVPVVAASDLTGAHPDEIAQGVARLRRGAPTMQIMQAVASAAGI